MRLSRVKGARQRDEARKAEWPQMHKDIRKLRAERDYWRAEYERVASERAYYIRVVAELAEAVAEGDYAKVAEIGGGPAVDVIARYPSLYAALKAVEGLRTLRQMFRLSRLTPATNFRELKIDIDVP